MQRHSVTSLETACSLANGPSWGGGGRGRSMYSAFPGYCSVSYLSFVYGRSLWAELNGGENSLHWKANMLPLFSIMTLCKGHTFNPGMQTALSIPRLVYKVSLHWSTTIQTSVAAELLSNGVLQLLFLCCNTSNFHMYFLALHNNWILIPKYCCIIIWLLQS